MRTSHPAVNDGANTATQKISVNRAVFGGYVSREPGKFQENSPAKGIYALSPRSGPFSRRRGPRHLCRGGRPAPTTRAVYGPSRWDDL